MTTPLNSLAIGAAAGLAAALLSIGLVMQTGLSLILFMLSPLPIMLAGLGWGPVTGAVSVFTFGAILFLATSNSSAIIFMLVMGIPALITVYWIGMGRNLSDGEQEWFPLGTAMFFASLAVAFGTLLSGMLIGYGPEYAGKLSVELVKLMASASPEFAADPVTTISMANFSIRIMPVVYPALWVAILAANLWVSMKISGRSGLISRPVDDWPTRLRLPQAALPLFALAMAGTFLTGGARMIVDVFVGSLGMAFVMSGFALFHQITRGKSWRIAALWFGWLLPVITGGLATAIFLFAGLYASVKKSSAS